ncbi:MAG: glycosyltransferase family 39 protein [Candidatus Parcubacteria bacterium]|nr:glycosyltransferase family 39 protein [Candidatus Parcubacteria bacterium]
MIRDRFIIILFCAAVLSGLLWGSKMLGQPLSTGGDEPLYNSIAKNIVEHGRFVSDEKDWANVSEPLYPLFLSGVYLVFGLDNFDAVRIIQILLFAFTVLLVYLLSEKLVSRNLAIAASLLTALFFPLAASAGVLYREVLFTFLVVLSVYLLYRIQEKPRLAGFILLGIILGLATLTNAIIQFFIVFAVLYFIFFFRKNLPWKNLALKLLFLVLFFLLTISGWSLGDYLNNGNLKPLNLKNGGALSRRVEMMESITGEKYFRHLGGQLFGYYFFEKEDFAPEEFLGHPKTTKRAKEMFKEGRSIEEINSEFARKNFSKILSDIPKYFTISVLDFLQFNGPMLPNPKTLELAPMQNLFIGGSHPGIPGFLKVVILLVLRILYWFFFGFVVYGLARAIKKWRKFGLIILIVFYFNLVYAAIFGIPRYAIPIYPFYILLFVIGLSAFLNRLSDNSISKNS